MTNPKKKPARKTRAPSATRSESLKAYHSRAREGVALSNFQTADSRHLEVNPVAVKKPTEALVTPYAERRISYEKYLQVTPEQLPTILESVDTGKLRDIQDFFDVLCQDVDVMRATNYRKSAVTSSPYQIEPASQEPEDIEAARLIQDCLAGLDDWDENLKDMLDGVSRGLSVHKICWTREDGVWKLEDLQWLHPRRFAYDDSFNLRLYDDGAYGTDGLHLEPTNFIVHNPKTLSGYQHRQGLLRSVAAYVVFAKLGLVYWLGGAEKFGFPMLLGEITEKASKEAKENLRRALENVSGYTAGVVEAGTTIKALDFQAPPVVIWDNLTRMLTQKIAEGIVGAKLVMDTSSDGGSWALGKEHKGVFISFVRADAKSLGVTLRKGLFRAILDRNKDLFSKKPKTPKIVWKIEDQPSVEQWHVEQGLISKEDAARLLGYAPLEVIANQQEGEEAKEGDPDLTPEEIEEIPITVGSIWTDTEDDHRLKVTRVISERVFFVDLDGPNPKRQYSFTKGTFVERCTEQTPAAQPEADLITDEAAE